MCIPKMPEEYKGEVTKSCGYTRTNPRNWTEKEIEWVKDLAEKGYTAKEIAESVDRTHTSVAIKMKRLGKKERRYNERHVDDKYASNDAFLEEMGCIATVLDVYAGERSFYEGKVVDVVANDKNPEARTEFHMDALRFCCDRYANGCKYDMVDLDPFGSAYDCFDLAIKMASKALVITFGELGHKRWKRLDYVGRYYGIEDMEGFTIEALIAEVQRIGRRNKKQLTPVIVKEWQNIGRVWFKVEPLKITEQWEGKLDV